MRRFAAVLWAALLFVPRPAYARTQSAVITAQQVALYTDRSLLVADGGVSIRFGQIEIDATHAVYDLRANQLTAAGHVTVKAPSGPSQGSGYVYDFTKKIGGLMPDAHVPEFAEIDALALGQQVELLPAVSITFSNANVRSGTEFVPAATYTYDIPPPNAKDFGYSPVPSAALEWPFIVSAGRNAYAFGRLRYDKYNGGVGAGLEEHYAASGRGYVGLGQTLDVDGGRFDLAAYQRINDTLSQSLTGSVLRGTRALRYAITASTSSGFSSLSFAQYGAQRSDDLFLTGNQHTVWGLGSSRLQITFGHDVHPGDWHTAQDFRVTPALHFDTATLHVARAAVFGSFDAGESLYDYGRATLASDAGIRTTLPVNEHLQLDGGVSFSHEAPPFPNTNRTYTGGFTWRAGPAFNLVSSLTYTHDFGQLPGTGRPQFAAAFDLRVRRKNGRGLEIGTIIPFGRVGDMNRQAVLNIRFLR